MPRLLKALKGVGLAALGTKGVVGRGAAGGASVYSVCMGFSHAVALIEWRKAPGRERERERDGVTCFSEGGVDPQRDGEGWGGEERHRESARERERGGQREKKSESEPRRERERERVPSSGREKQRERARAREREREGGGQRHLEYLEHLEDIKMSMGGPQEGGGGAAGRFFGF